MTRPDRAGRRRRLHVLALTLGLLGVAACQQKMAHQPYYRPYEESAFFDDHRSARPLERGTVSRFQLPDDHPLMSGLSAKGRALPKKLDTGNSPDAPLAGAPFSVDNFVNEFPIELTEADLQRGLERYTIFCTPCHSPLGDGKGKIVERGYLKPTNYHTDVARGFERFRVNGPDGNPLLLRDAPVGYYFEVISRGFGGMPDYSTQIPPADRWRIVAYIKALQLSQAADPSLAPAGPQKKDSERKHP